MKIFFDNVNFGSTSGPNSFALKLANAMSHLGHRVNQDPNPDVQLSFINAVNNLAPTYQRLDGIYFNSEQDWQALNEPILKTYQSATGVIFQSSFNKKLTERYFGTHPNACIIHNGTDVEEVRSAPKFVHASLDGFDKVWACASSWRPHKRLGENIRFFLEHAPDNDCLVVAGENPDVKIDHPRVFYVGNLDRKTLLSVYSRAEYFVHLALMDHCPNVVIDARAAGCQIVCASSGGTQEIAGPEAIVIEDMIWSFEPFALYKPPALDFSRIIQNPHVHDINIDLVAIKYLEFLGSHTS